MKTPEFWYQSRGFMSYALAPASWLYRAGAKARRWRARPYRARIPVLCIGNIVAGGAGKTPAALALARLLREAGHKPVFVTRGYGGKEQGPVRVDPARHTAREVGDEALLLARAAPAWVGRDRAAAVRKAETEGSHIILDDGFQNPHVLYDRAFLVIDETTGFGNGMILPAGPLREKAGDALGRASAVMLVASEDRPETPLDLEAEGFKGPVLRCRIAPEENGTLLRGQKVLAFAGIGRPGKFYQTCRSIGLVLAATMDFPDHHAFTTRDMARLQDAAGKRGARLITTEKDWVRVPEALRPDIAVLPVSLIFDDPDALRRMVE